MGGFYSTLVMAHSGWRYLVLIAVIVALVKFIAGWLQNGTWGSLDSLLARVTPIVLDVQWLLGLILILTRLFSPSLGGASGVLWEHAATLTIAVLVAHLATYRIRGATKDASKYRTAALLYILIALLLVVGIMRVLGWNIFGM